MGITHHVAHTACDNHTMNSDAYVLGLGRSVCKDLDLIPFRAGYLSSNITTDYKAGRLGDAHLYPQLWRLRHGDLKFQAPGQHELAPLP